MQKDLESDFDSLRPGHSAAAGASRRTTLKAALGVGEISHEVNGLKVPAYGAAPASPAFAGADVRPGYTPRTATSGLRWPGMPTNPIDIAASLHAPVLGLYGAQDAGIPLDTLDKMKAALATGNAASRASQFVVYPEASQAFHADDRTSDRKEAAQDGWKRCLAWLKANGVARCRPHGAAAFPLTFQEPGP